MKPDVAYQVDQALRSIEGIQQAEASPFLYGRIMERIKQPVSRPSPVPVWVYRLAVAVVFLFLLNLLSLTWLRQNNRPQHRQEPAHTIAEEYFGNETLYTY